MSSLNRFPAAEPPPGVVDRAPCRNCGAQRLGGYCHRCGQHFRDDRLTFRSILRELPQRATLEEGLPRAFVEMCTDPGGLVRRYVSGQRRRYVSPLAYLFFGAALMLLVWPFYSQVMSEWAQGQTSGAAEVPHPVFSPAQEQAFHDLTLRVTEQTAIGGLTMAFPFALLLCLLFRRSGINLAEAAVFALFVFGHAYAIHSLLVPAMWAAGAGPGIYMATMYAALFWVVAHTAVTFFGRPFASSLKATLALVGSYAVWSVMLGVVLVAWVLTFH